MNKPPSWFYVAAVILILWECIGCYAYLSDVTMTAADMAQLPVAQQDIWKMTPSWVTAAYALAVWIGLAASIALLLRFKIARSLYVVSLIAVVAQFGWTFVATPILTTIGPSAAIFPAFIIAVGVMAVWFSGKAAGHGWLR
jgi:predicted neutral ceramidase superfamily lipid hydrolase